MAGPESCFPDRRRFISLAAGGVGSVLTLRPPALQANGVRRRPVEFIVVSDTHLGYRDRAHAAVRWRQTADEIARSVGEVVLHLGDVVDGGREAQYPIYLDVRKRIAKPVHEIPGNHDPQDLFQKYIRRNVDTFVDLAWLRFLLLNNSRTDSHDGFLSDAQIRWIDRQCHVAARKDRFVILCMHVPVHSNRHPDRGWYVKPEHGQARLYQTIARHRRRVVALFHGHFHNGIRGWDDHRPVHEICFPSALYNQDRRLEQQKAPGYNPAEFRPGFVLVRIDQGMMQLRYKPLAADVHVRKELPLAVR